MINLKKPQHWYRMPTAVFLIGVFSITLLLWVNRISDRQRVNSLFIGALMDIQIRTATAHLWLEQAVSGDTAVDVDKQILAEMEQSINLATVLLNGGQSEHGPISVPFKEPDRRARTEAIRSMLLEFKALALVRLRDPGSNGITSLADRQIDAVFKELLGKAGALEDLIEKNSASDLEQSRRLYLGILAAWTFIVIAATAGLWSREMRRKSAEEALLSAHGQLLSQAEELTAHRERLAQLVEMRTAELTAANELLRVEIGERRRVEGEVRQLNEGLELKVAERTRQLVETQEELVRSEKMAMLGQIAGSMGNELRNPLGVMNNAVYFLKTVLPDADETVGEYLEIIGHEIDNAQRIISALLDFFQDWPIEAKLIPVPELVRQSLERAVIPENVRFRADLPETLPAVRIDPLQMGEVLRNLITNAVQAMPDGGALRIAARKIGRSEDRKEEALETSALPRFRADADFVEVSVEDTGEGIAPEHMERLFQPLFSTKSRGIGLGLAISRKLAEANGGGIEVESRLEKGTTFRVTLPAGGE